MKLWELQAKLNDIALDANTSDLEIVVDVIDGSSIQDVYVDVCYEAGTQIVRIV
jgi:hypothetical protein